MPPAPPAPAVPASAQGSAAGMAAAGVGTQRHQFETAAEKQVTEAVASAGSQAAPAAVVAAQTGSPAGMLVTVAPPPSTIETSVSTGAPDFTEVFGVHPAPPASAAARQATSSRGKGRFIRVSL
jgi:hypothetical protein